MNLAQKIHNIVLSCENQDPNLLIDSVDRVLTEKLLDSFKDIKQTMGKTLLESTKKDSKKEDKYENYDPKIKEAIDYCVESVMEGGLELSHSILMASKQYNVKEEQIKEYFNDLLEITSDVTDTRVVSTSSDDEDDKRGMRDDEDTNKRVRYESAQLTLGDGKTVVISEEFWEETIKPVLDKLNFDNRKALMEQLLRNKTSFINAVGFCQKVIKG